MARGRDYPDSLGVEDLAGVSEAETLAGPVVHRPDAGLQLLGRDLGQLRAFGQVLAQEAVGVLKHGSLRFGERSPKIMISELIQRQGWGQAGGPGPALTGRGLPCCGWAGT